MGIPMGAGISLGPDGSPPLYAHRVVIRSHLTGSRERPEMTRYERKLHFERLMAMREAYRAEAPESTDITIERAMTFAEQAFNDAVASDVAAVEAALTKGASKAD
jgi:hypothetical protein